jgi:pimeloyl-ACP methyl ester carboxylesterase
VGVDFAELGVGKLEIAYFKDIIEHIVGPHMMAADQVERKLETVQQDIQADSKYVRLPDDYLDSRLASILPADKYTIVPIRWSRDPDESAEAVPLVEAGIKRIFADAKAQGRPVYLVAHSWGTVLAHTALHRLAKSDPQVRIEKFITLGSPLVPGHWWLDIFMKYEIKQGQLQAHVAKPANVAAWVNLWGYNDLFSNQIAAADRNLLVDNGVSPLELQIKKAAEADHSLRPQAALDLFKLKSPKSWHFAYIYDLKFFLKTIQKEFDQAVLGPVVSGELAY